MRPAGRRGWDPPSGWCWGPGCTASLDRRVPSSARGRLPSPRAKRRSINFSAQKSMVLSERRSMPAQPSLALPCLGASAGWPGQWLTLGRQAQPSGGLQTAPPPTQLRRSSPLARGLPAPPCGLSWKPASPFPSLHTPAVWGRHHPFLSLLFFLLQTLRLVPWEPLPISF